MMKRYKCFDPDKSPRGVDGKVVEAESPYEAIKTQARREGCVVEFWTKHDPTGGGLYAAATLRNRMGRRVKMAARLALWGRVAVV